MKKLYFLIAVIIGVSSINAKTKLTSKNINQVISAMTLEEKASLLVGYTKGYNPHGKATAKEGDPDPYVPGASGMTHGNEKYGIPYTVFTDGPAGVNIDVDRKGDSHKYYASGFMTGPCVASSWNTSLVYELGRIMGNAGDHNGKEIVELDDIKAELPFQSKFYIWKVNNVLKPSKNEK